MTYGKLQENQFLLRLERGEDIPTTLKDFCIKQNVQNASITGIGSIESPTLAHYKVDTKKYSEKQLEGTFEVTSLLGNVTILENQPLLHLHITIGNEDMQAFAGHLIKGQVSATLEVTINKFPTTFEKKHSEEIGLNLLNLPESNN